jgi:hypothetical protein
VVLRDELIFCCEIKLVDWQTALWTLLDIKGFFGTLANLSTSLRLSPAPAAIVAFHLLHNLAPTPLRP